MENKFSLDDLLKKNVKTLSFLGILGVVLAYGPRACMKYAGKLTSLVATKIETMFLNLLASGINFGLDAYPVVKGWYQAAARICRKWFIRSLIVVAIYFALILVGVFLELSFIIAITGLGIGLYFFILSFVIEMALSVVVGGYNLSEDGLRLLAKVPKTVLEKAGLRFEAGNIALSREKIKRKIKDIRFVGVPFTILAFWLALFPSLTSFGFALVVVIGVFSLALISYWLDWTSKIWRYYYFIAKWTLVVAITCFALSSAFPEAWRAAGPVLRDKATRIVTGPPEVPKETPPPLPPANQLDQTLAPIKELPSVVAKKEETPPSCKALQDEEDQEKKNHTTRSALNQRERVDDSEIDAVEDYLKEVEENLAEIEGADKRAIVSSVVQNSAPARPVQAPSQQIFNEKMNKNLNIIRLRIDPKL